MMKYGKYILWFVVLIPIMLLRDYTPDNELRYLNIADDALLNGRLFTFFNDGVAYADKPPLYLWIVMASRALLGTHSMLWLGLFSILPAFVILYIMDRWTSRELDFKNRFTAQLMLLTTAYFIGGMVVLRMDMLMTMFIVLALWTFYRMYIGEGKRFERWLLPAYVFLALFTKGPFGVMIPVASIFVFLLIKKDICTIGRYLGWRFWTLLITLCLVWFGFVYAEGGNEYLNNLLFNQTVNRAVDSFSHKKGLFFYFGTFGYALAPWSLFYAGMLLVTVCKKIIMTNLESFFLTVFIVSFTMLSLISAKLEIYLLPAYPFIAYLSIMMLQRVEWRKWSAVLIAIPAIVLSLTFPVVSVLGNLVSSMKMLDTYSVYIAAFILTVAGFYALYTLYKWRYMNKAINSIAIGLLCAIFVGSFFVPDINEKIGYGCLARKAGELAKERNIDKYISYKVPRSSGMKVYLNQNVEGLEWDDLQMELSQNKHVMLLLRNKVIKREEPLQELIANKERHEIGGYSVVVW